MVTFLPWCREALGSEVEMVSLEMEVEQVVARVSSRHAGDQNSIDVMKVTTTTFD